MSIERRDFLKLCSLSSMALVAPWAVPLARAGEGDGYDGPLWINVHAGGGWDPTSLCDPKGRANEDAEGAAKYMQEQLAGAAESFAKAGYPIEPEQTKAQAQNLEKRGL